MDQLTKMSDKISEQVRAVCLGILAVTWGLLVGDSGIAKAISNQLKGSLLAIGVAAIMVMVLDFLQYVAGYFDTLLIFNDAQARNATEASWDSGSFLYRMRQFCFYFKQVMLLVVVAAMLWKFGRWWLG